MKDKGLEASGESFPPGSEDGKPPASLGYGGLAQYYGDLFPVSGALKGFLSPLVERCLDKHETWLDVGCGTGALVEWLREQGVAAYGIDPDEDFIREAKRNLGVAEEIVAAGRMTDWGDFSGRTWGVVTCLGNVAAHAENLEELEILGDKCAQSLAPAGTLILQTVNFDRVLGDREWDFPVLERDAADGKKLRFFREYRHSGERLLFKTRLEVQGATVAENTALLLPLQREPLENLLRKSFERITVRGDFGAAAWSPTSPATLYLAEAPVPRNWSPGVDRN